MTTRQRFRPGDTVLTPLRRPARVLKLRTDGKVDLQYVAETVALPPELLEHVALKAKPTTDE
jgi:hypothetical protein